MTKRSYMNRDNILSEGFYKNLLMLLAGGHLAKFLSKLQTNRKFKPEILKINSLVKDLEKGFEKEFGKKVKFDKFKISDFKKS